MKILLLRHGTAIDAAQAGGSDSARTLSAEGRAQAVQTAEAFRRLGLKPGRIVTSPLPRAAETARITAKALGFGGAVVEDERLEPGAPPESFREAIEGGVECDEIMLVGHNPDLEEFVAWLIAPKEKGGIVLGKGSLAVVEVEGGKRGLARPGGGTLVALLPSKSLRRLSAQT